MAEEKNNRIASLDGLRAIACIGIILMHMRANNDYNISGFLYNSIIPAFTDFVYLFMVLSAFGLCFGYYEKFKNKSVDLSKFYSKRYLKILPFFSLLVLLDLALNFSIDSVYESIADISLTFGLFPNDIQVIGVGWFLGLIFAFYMIFPFFCTLIETKKKAWFFFVVSLIINFVCKQYFHIGRQNIIFSFCFFIAGGLLFLYKEQLSKIKWFISLPLLMVGFGLYFLIGDYTIIILFISVLFVIFALGKAGKIFDNKVFHFISGISMEMYLSHMVIFRIAEKIRLTSIFENSIVQYTFTCVLVITLDIVFAFLAQKIISILISKFFNKKKS